MKIMFGQFGLKIKILILFYVLTLFTPKVVNAAIDLDSLAVDFAIKKFQIQIPYYSRAFNPSIVRWKGKILLSFRIPDQDNDWKSCIGLIWLNEDFSPNGYPYILNTRETNPGIPSRSQDARLIVNNSDELYIVFNDNLGKKDRGIPKMFYAKVWFENNHFLVKNIIPLNNYEGERRKRWEKNWVPFFYNERLLFAYSINPHRIIAPFHHSCLTIANSKAELIWPWGLERIFGGTPALLVKDEYLAFFHSSCGMQSVQSDRERVGHYFFGAYTFEKDPPFRIKKISPSPIIATGMYRPAISQHRIVFPGGFMMDDDFIWLTYGRDDHEIWMIKLDKEELLNSLINVKSFNAKNE